MDFQNRAGSKPGSGGMASRSAEGIARKERLRQLAEETMDLEKDPYFMKNHVGLFECKLCLTLHKNHGNYLAHTQGKRHQQNLARRAAREAKTAMLGRSAGSGSLGGLIPPQEMFGRGGGAASARAAATAAAASAAKAAAPVRRRMEIGRPGYTVKRMRQVGTGRRVLVFELFYKEIREGLQPLYRLMSAFEQKAEAADRRYQYLVVAAEPYQNVGFRLPAREVASVDTDWRSLAFKLTLTFKTKAEVKAAVAAASAPGGGGGRGAAAVEYRTRVTS